MNTTLITHLHRRRGRMVFAAHMLLLCAAQAAMAQILTIGGGDAGSGLRVTPPVASQGDQRRVVRMADLVPESAPVTLFPVPFNLVLPDGSTAGSVAYGNGMRVELGGATYEIADATGTNFFLRVPGGAVSGPFEYRNGAPLRAGAQTYVLKKSFSFVQCKLALKDVPAAKVRLALVPLQGVASARLVQLRQAYAQIKLKADSESAPRQSYGPAIYGPPGSRRDSAEIQRSAADIARAEASANQQARKAFEHFQSCEGARVTTLVKQGVFSFSDLLPGLYALCMMADARSTEDVRTSPLQPRVWWATVSLQDGECAVVLFRQDQGRDWRELFPK